MEEIRVKFIIEASASERLCGLEAPAPKDCAWASPAAICSVTVHEPPMPPLQTLGLTDPRPVRRFLLPQGLGSGEKPSPRHPLSA